MSWSSIRAFKAALLNPVGLIVPALYEMHRFVKNQIIRHDDRLANQLKSSPNSCLNIISGLSFRIRSKILPCPLFDFPESLIEIQDVFPGFSGTSLDSGVSRG